MAPQVRDSGEQADFWSPRRFSRLPRTQPRQHSRDVEFEWNRKKAQANRVRHGVDFEQAAEVFADVLSSIVADPDHSVAESRFVIFGRSHLGRHLVISFTDRGGKIRIISARRMTRREREAYER